MRDPLMVLTWFCGAGLLAVLGRYVLTGELDKEILTGLGTIMAGLIGALSNRKDGDKEDDGNPS